ESALFSLGHSYACFPGGLLPSRTTRWRCVKTQKSCSRVTLLLHRASLAIEEVKLNSRQAAQCGSERQPCCGRQNKVSSWEEQCPKYGLSTGERWILESPTVDSGQKKDTQATAAGQSALWKLEERYPSARPY
ncbi:mCG145903, partial [Mus musculus]